MEKLEQKSEQPLPENLSITSRNETQSPKPVREYSDPIPVDILIDIFSRLSRKTTMRFRCVSKLWGYILRPPDFTELFLTNSYTRPRIFFTVVSNHKLFFYSSPQPQNPDHNSTLVATRYHTSFPEYFPFDNCSTVCGLTLLQGDYEKKSPVICNPITGDFITLPEVKAKAKSSYLGYDPTRKQFKVLCLNPSLYETPKIHQVLTLESGKHLWREIECGFRFTESGRTGGEVCIDGILYFGAKLEQRWVIVCFDVRYEKFGFINIDKDMLSEHDTYCRSGFLALFNYKGKLGMRNTSGFRDTYHFVLWVLEDAGSHKWSKHTYVLPISTIEKWFVGMTGSGEVVLSSYRYNLQNLFRVYFYNLERKSFTTLDFQGFEEFKYHITINTFVDYVENLKFM
ncbi:unnamed protein product [Microthlaspi erraticum]|uniref:F-box domain-containing protein n=1 Tax=Microthlaspi erraticum TaxID=1685480 RepID=A0A6D2K285_9BRAS|nr:unnamed protein product [Microthlaspi erraticum]